MEHERLTQILATLGEQNVEIDHALIFKTGCTCLEHKDGTDLRLGAREPTGGDGKK